MEKSFEKIIWGLVMVLTLTATLAVGFKVTTVKSTPSHQVEKAEVSNPSTQFGKIYAQRDAYVYTYYYRKYNGWIQRRLWNRTLGRWAESSWKNVKKIK